MSWVIRLIASSFLGIAVLSLPQQPNQLKQANLIQPGFITMPLEGSDIFISYMNVGSPGNITFFAWDSLTSDIILTKMGYTYNTSLTYAPAGHNSSITLLDFDLQPFIVTGPLAYERFNFSNTLLYGQGFLLSDENIYFEISSLGFNLDYGNFSELGFPTWINSLWQQGLIQHRLLSFSYLLESEFVKGGNVTIGALPEGVPPEALNNYTVDINHGHWAFSLTDMQWGDLSLGFNGYLTIATISPLSVVPMPVFTTLISLLGQPPLGFGNVGGISFAGYNATQFPDLSVLPKITLYLHHQPLVFTATQYMACGFGLGYICILTFGGASDVYPYNAAFTLGTLTLNTTYSVFDFEQKTFGVAPMSIM